MTRFFLGFAAAVVVIVAAAFCFVRFGLVDPRADIPVNSLDAAISMPALDASVDRRAPEARNPVPATDDNLTAGMKLYQTNCASCHGDIVHPHGVFADALYPRSPQFVEDAPDMPENQNFYIIQHGVRWSGMPAWQKILSEQQMWEVTAFLGHMDKLPPQISAAWRASASQPGSQ